MTAATNTKLKRVMDTQLAQVLSHPLRAHVLATVNERVCSPNEIAREVDLPVSDVSYHARQLRDQRYIELVRTRPRRGVTEHFYGATASLLLNDREWTQLPQSVQPGMSADLFGQIVTDVLGALEVGSFDARGRHLSRIAMFVDERGWNDLMRVLGEALERVLVVQAECADRIDETDQARVPALVALAGFERRPGPKPAATADRADG